MSYKIIQAFDIEALEAEVIECMSQGWVPTGGLLSIPSRSQEGYSKFTQAMVKL